MTRISIREYSEAVWWRYLRSAKVDKGKVLVEFTKVTGFHRKTAIRLLHQANKLSVNKKRGRPQQYRAAVVGALRVVGKPLTGYVPSDCVHFCLSWSRF